MGHSNGVISAPVNTDDVGAVIGSSSHDVATLCMDSRNKINMWARNKPENTGGPAALTDAQRKANNFGLRPPTTYSSVSNYIYAADTDSLQGWTYDKPSEAKNSWFRLTDFDNYRNDSACPFPSLAQGDYILGSLQLEVQLALGFEGNENTTDYINMSDLQMNLNNISNNQLKDYYYGICLIKDNTHYWMATADDTLSDGGTKIVFTMANNMQIPPANTGDDVYRGYVFLANKPFQTFKNGSQQGGEVSGLTLVPITSESVDCKVVTSDAMLVVQAHMQGSKLIVDITSRYEYSYTFTPKTLYHRSGGSGDGNTVLIRDSSFSAFTIAAMTNNNPTKVTKSYQTLLIANSGGEIRLKYSSTAESGDKYTNWSAVISPTIQI